MVHRTILKVMLTILMRTTLSFSSFDRFRRLSVEYYDRPAVNSEQYDLRLVAVIESGLLCSIGRDVNQGSSEENEKKNAIVGHRVQPSARAVTYSAAVVVDGKCRRVSRLFYLGVSKDVGRKQSR